ncbi:MAG: molybdopterin molybdotransferase MoeA [Gammaproteobacteria bacterium]|nr:molybdopterin molybdotransferase MoeA [Gammaproteobacteria bacterium]
MTTISPKHDPSCMDDYDPNSLDAKQALQQILTRLQPIAKTEVLPIRDALGRIIAEEIRSKIDVPGHTNSAMDGYAIDGAELPSQGQQAFVVAGTAWAGRPYLGNVKSGECIRIMTGAAMPENTDTVIMQEHVQKDGGNILVDNTNKLGQNVRQAGEDIATGEITLTRGNFISPAELGLLASVGISEVRVLKKIRIAFFSTGDELQPVGSVLEKGQIYDSNRYTLYGMLARLGVEIIDMGVIKDKKDAIKQAFNKAALCADVVITSGGVSVGDADFVKETLESIGEVNFWKVAMKPGRPLAFGKIKDAWFFGLPGNPVSVMVTFYMFVQPALKKMMGSAYHEPLIINATSNTQLRKRPGRIEYQRGVLTRIEHSDPTVCNYEVIKTGAQGSGILRSMSNANCFIILPTDSSDVEIGDSVQVLPFEAIV